MFYTKCLRRTISDWVNMKALMTGFKKLNILKSCSI